MKLDKKNGVFRYIVVLSFIFIVTSSLAISKFNKRTSVGKTPRVIQKVLSYQEESFPALPKLKSNATFPILSAQAVLAIDLKSSVTLYEKNPNLKLLPASTTKIVTALVAMDYYAKDRVIVVEGISKVGQTMGLINGENITVNDLLYGLLISSANDAAEALAQGSPGGREMFIAAMNDKARELNLINTSFTNPSGLDSEGHVSTAADLIRVAEFAMQNPYFSQIVKIRKATVGSTDGKVVHNLENINTLLGKVEGVQGVKTGWTENARENLVTYIERDEHRVMIALMGSQDRFGETEELINWIFENYEWQEVNYP
jgi:D-alanyl-D-alanine carboxypeptidase (penicillin-binding protein 5/6)